MQHQQYRDADLHGAVRSVLALLLLLAAVPLVTLTVGQREPPPAPLSLPRLDAELGVAIGEPLYSAATGAPPVMDGIAEAAWDRAPMLMVPLHYGLHGAELAGVAELRSLHDAERVYFLIRWPSETPGGEPGVWRNLLTVHWRLVDSGEVSGESTGSEGLACTVGCHTATADGEGRLVGIRTETIPPGLNEDLPSGGGWSAGTWLLEWSRPKVSENPYDQEMSDPERGYRFFVKLFQGLDDRPDPVSDVHELRLER
jgi:hypothetical protein